MSGNPVILASTQKYGHIFPISMSHQTPQSIDTLITARWIIPIRPAKTVLENHSIAIDGGNIIAILPKDEAMARFDANYGIDLPEHVLTPGLINAHGHAAMSLFRGMADDQPLQTWLEEFIWPAEGQWVSEEFVRDGTQLAVAEMLRSGTTTFSDMYFFPNVVAKVASEAGIRAQITFPVFNFPTIWGQDPNDYIEKGLAVRDDFKHSELVDVVFGPHAPYTVSDEGLQKVSMLAAELDISIHIHVHETQQEVDDDLKLHGQRPISRLNDLGILGPKTQLVHMTALTDEDIAIVKASGASVVHCPQSNLKLASGFCPVKVLADEGITIALGTDGAASNNSLDMFAEMRAAALLAKAVSKDASALSDWQALEAATLGGAKALSIDSKLGTLEVGKQADIIAIDFSAIELQPLYDPVSQLVYTACGHHVTHSWVHGQQVLADRQPANLDIPEIAAKAQGWRDKISNTTNTKH
ncbi:TRZ/ATZ family hydrolase [Oceanicoccus sp.]|uniref:TRZ/ATZ family hydrolase n=2 Tax=Oceanicoccus sp. TaxID=2691044 RepID=UPI003429F483